MWTQDYLAAPWTTTQLFDQLHTNLTTDGWTAFEDLRGDALPYIIYRNNLGTGRDILLYIDITTSTNNANHRSIRTFTFEHSAYTPGSAIVPDSTVYQIGQDLDTNVNLLINHASTPNNKNMCFWFEQGVNVSEETTIFSIEPYVLADGTTLMNSGDDGTSYPLWASYYKVWNAASQKGGGLFSRSEASFSAYFEWGDNAKPQRATFRTTQPFYNNGAYSSVKSLFFETPRAPAARIYTMTTRPGAWHSYASQILCLAIPTKRIDTWSGGAAFVEGFRPEIISGALVSTNMHVDPRGYIGAPGDILIARSFGGARSDSFTVDAKTYRIVSSVNEGTGASQLQVELAMRVA